MIKVSNQAMLNKYLLMGGLGAVCLLAMMEPAMASSAGSVTGGGTAPTGNSADAPFDSFLGMLIAWSTGALGKSLAIAAFLVGLGLGVLKQNIIGLVVGMVMALALALGPQVIIGIFSATLTPDIASLNATLNAPLNAPLSSFLPAVCGTPA